MTQQSSASLSLPHPYLYESNIWVWLHERSRKMNRAIRLGDVPDREWDELQVKGLESRTYNSIKLPGRISRKQFTTIPKIRNGRNKNEQ